MAAHRAGTPPASHAVIVCHPSPDSFTHAVADAYCAMVRECGQEAIVRDLYAMGFDPVLKDGERPTVAGFTPAAEIAAEIALIGGCDAFTFVYPIWFGTPPAMLKGYVERVLGSGVDPRAVQQRGAHPFLTGKRLVSFTSSGASDAWLNEQGELLALRTLFDRYLVHAFAMRGEQHYHFPRIVPGLRDRFVEENLLVVRDHARRICGELLIEHHRGRVIE